MNTNISFMEKKEHEHKYKLDGEKNAGTKKNSDLDC